MASVDKWIPGVMFANPSLEERFRDLVTGNTEVGGMLLLQLHDSPRFTLRRTWETLVDNSDWVYIIHSWVIFPNTHKDPSTHWMTWDWEKAREIAIQTAKSLGLRTLHFHSHPAGSTNQPSTKDVAFACVNSPFTHSSAVSAIAQCYPMRLNLWRIEHGGVSGLPPSNFEIQKGQYYSWREKRFYRYRNMV